MKTAPKIKWKVNAYVQWHGRAWPDAEYADGSPAASITCVDDYHISKVKSGNHQPLTLNFADYSFTHWKWRRFKKQFATLAEAKAFFSAYLAEHHETFAKKTSTDISCPMNPADLVQPTADEGPADGNFDDDVKRQSNPTDTTRRTRENTKQAQVIAMLRRPEGATIAQITEATEWNSNTVRGVMAGALKKKLGLNVVRMPHTAGGTSIYQIQD